MPNLFLVMIGVGLGSFALGGGSATAAPGVKPTIAADSGVIAAHYRRRGYYGGFYYPRYYGGAITATTLATTGTTATTLATGAITAAPTATAAATIHVISRSGSNVGHDHIFTFAATRDPCAMPIAERLVHTVVERDARA
jgi:hypothetical protein